MFISGMRAPAGYQPFPPFGVSIVVLRGKRIRRRMKSFLSMDLWKSAAGTVEKVWGISRIFRESKLLPSDSDLF